MDTKGKSIISYWYLKRLFKMEDHTFSPMENHFRICVEGQFQKEQFNEISFLKDSKDLY
jgi:hypothetical protein